MRSSKVEHYIGSLHITQKSYERNLHNKKLVVVDYLIKEYSLISDILQNMFTITIIYRIYIKHYIPEKNLIYINYNDYHFLYHPQYHNILKISEISNTRRIIQ